MRAVDQSLSDKIEDRRNLYRRKIYKKKILLIGCCHETHTIAENLLRISDEYLVVGCMSTSNRDPVPYVPDTTLHIFGELREMEIFLNLIPLKINIIILADPEIRHHQVLKILGLARKYGVELWTIPMLANAFVGDLRFFSFYGHPVIKIMDNKIPRHKLIWKTAFDYIGALLGLLVSFPILLLIALLIKLTSTGPILYRQERVGKNGKVFKVIKFRSMLVNADSTKLAFFSQINDSQVTPLGRFLRKTHLDELPQLFNIFEGTMSIVGPRPERSIYVEEYTSYMPFYNDRFVIKPGITGMAQVYGAYHSKAEEKLIFDLNYIHNLNLFLDIKICLRTLWIEIKSLLLFWKN